MSVTMHKYHVLGCDPVYTVRNVVTVQGKPQKIG